jgi:hypothetical protein
VTPRDVTTPNPAAPARPTDTEIIERAEEALDDLCSGKRRWTMTVPPEVTDQDVVFSDLIALAKRLLWNDAALAEARAAERRAVIPSANDLTDIIEQAIFETDTGLEAALLATERILDAVATDTPEEPER